ncbi:antifreeze glycoprotein [Patulibacter medicamentivorans]|uniref:Antifreeze glycoprotein n=1 Tax=Patulibacter medicamentivorans TaxID=1097667 RepID=H0E006_9ACTN|nr:hypothetical protein [Patulibacter medicamentivorans]EHN12965.1 antifreeze glycoprotein [Patulibacter medicamentivorans]
MSTLLSVAGVAAATLAGPAAAPAEDAEWSRAGDYACSTLGGLAPSTGELAVRLRTAATVVPGGTLTASGRLQLTLTSGAPALAGLLTLSRSAQLAPGTIGLPVRVATPGGIVERIVVLRDVRAEPASIPGLGEPLVLAAALTLPPIVLPSDATGDVEILLPRDGTAASDGGGDDAAFTGTVRFDGGLLRDTPLACRAAGAPKAIVARIPIVAAPAPPPAAATTPATTTTATTPERPGTTTRSAPAPATSGGTDSGDAGGATDGGAELTADAETGSGPGTSGDVAGEPDPFTDAETASATVWAPVPAATRGDGDVVVPAWVLGVLLAALLTTMGRQVLGGWRRLQEAKIEGDPR